MPFGSLSLRPVKTTAPVEERLHDRGRPLAAAAIVENDRARRLTLRIDSGGRGLRITVPPGVARREVDRFLTASRTGWSSGWPRCPSRPQVRPGIKLPLRGVPHLIVHEPDTRGTVTVGATAPAADADRAWRAPASAAPARRFPEARGQARHRGAGREAHRRDRQAGQGDPLSRHVEPLGLLHLGRDAVLLLAHHDGAAAVINYLVAHEVAHLKEMNHGPKFWKLCEELCPDTERCQAWLKRNGGALQAIQFE